MLPFPQDFASQSPGGINFHQHWGRQQFLNGCSSVWDKSFCSSARLKVGHHSNKRRNTHTHFWNMQSNRYKQLTCINLFRFNCNDFNLLNSPPVVRPKIPNGCAKLAAPWHRLNRCHALPCGFSAWTTQQITCELYKVLQSYQTCEHCELWQMPASVIMVSCDAKLFDWHWLLWPSVSANPFLRRKLMGPYEYDVVVPKLVV
jgi:hypothetical protein